MGVSDNAAAFGSRADPKARALVTYVSSSIAKRCLRRLGSTPLRLDCRHVAGGIGLTGEHPTLALLALRQEVVGIRLNVRSPAPPVVALVLAWEITAESIFPNAPNTRARTKPFRQRIQRVDSWLGRHRSRFLKSHNYFSYLRKYEKRRYRQKYRHFSPVDGSAEGGPTSWWIAL
jgi:hypothetical protein